MVRIQNFNTGVAQAHFGAEAGNGAGNASNTRTPDASSPFKGFTDHAADNNAPRRAIGDRFRSFFRGDVKAPCGERPRWPSPARAAGSKRQFR